MDELNYQASVSDVGAGEQRLKQLVAALVPAGHEQLHAAETKRWKEAWRQRLVACVLVLSDVLLAFLAWGVAYVLQDVWGRGTLPIGVAVAIVAPVTAAWVAVRALLGLYRGYGLDSVEELRRHAYAVFATAAIAAIFAVGSQLGDLLSRLLLAAGFMGLLFLGPPARHFVKWVARKARLWGKPVVILGFGEVGAHVTGLLQERWELGYKPVAAYAYRLAPAKESLEEDPNSDKAMVDAAALARKQGLDTVIIAMPHVRREQLAKILAEARINFRHVLIVPNLAGVTNSAVVARDLAGTFAVEMKHNLLDPWALRVKRMMDLVATVFGGTLILPLILLLSVLVWLDSRGGPVLYRDQRMGRDNRPFSCLKFRTMLPDAEALLQRMLEEDGELREEYLRYHKLRADPRVTRIGRFLRKTSLDELPQLWNVLKGEMSLVGPRPYLPRESAEIGVAQGEILRVPPGITGLWQTAGRNRTSFGERVQMDAYYVRDWSVWLDLVILARTAKSVVLGRGAY